MSGKPFRPMKPANAGDLATLRYPLIAQPKIDGIRCVTAFDGRALTYSLKAIPNDATRWALESLAVLRGLDGELVLRGAETFGETSSAVMSQEGVPRVDYCVFDDLFLARDGVRYGNRLARVRERLHRVIRVKRVTVRCISYELMRKEADVLRYEERMLDADYEGLILRDPDARYKHGRSTRLEQGLLKLKRFEDAEAEVLGVEPLYANDNAAQRNALGLTERSSRKAGKRRRELLGKLVVRDLRTGVEFRVGYGFTAAQRQEYWQRREQLVGKLVKYRHQPYGAKDKPRIAGFLGFRHEDDL